MTNLLNKAVAVLRELPPEGQNEVAAVLLRLIGMDEDSPVPLSLDEAAAITRSKAAAARGDFATDEAVRVTWAKHGF
jgi:hypothetical protein